MTLKSDRDHLLIKGNPCTKFGFDQVKESKDIERTTQWTQKSGLTLTFEHVTLKSDRDHLLIEGNPCTKFGFDQVKESKDIERTTPWAEKNGLAFTFEKYDLENQKGSTYLGQPLHQVWYWSSEGVKRYWAENTFGWEEWFDLGTCDLENQ